MLRNKVESNEEAKWGFISSADVTFSKVSLRPE